MTTETVIEDETDVRRSSCPCSHCQKPATFMCSSCEHEGPRYCSIECQKAHWKTRHYKDCKAAKRNRALIREASARVRSTTAEGETQPNEEIAMNDLSNNTHQTEDNDSVYTEEGDLRYYTIQIYRIIKPVVACIILSIFWVKVAFGSSSEYSPIRPNYVTVSSSTSTTDTGTTSSADAGSGSNSLATSFTNAAIIISQIIIVTILIVFFFKKGWIKPLIAFFMVVVLLLLGFMSYLLLLNLVQVFSIALDYVTLVFALWNFAVVGLVSIFWKGPLWLQQTYLTIMSSLMAFSLTGLEQWTTWILLGLLAIWDLVAVLCPFGPLRLLIESSKKQQREVPALLYSVNAVWFMMASANDHFKLSTSIAGSGENITSGRSEKINYRHSSTLFIQQKFINRSSHDGFIRLADDNTAENSSEDQGRQQEETHPTVPSSTEKDEEDEERSGLKLGLGDFVFYSVLIARAAMYDWITTVCCTIAVLTGLTATIFLLAIFNKALPALPISIAFGILFYFVAKTVLVPYIGTLCVFGMVGI